jgi:hypothetical protein
MLQPERSIVVTNTENHWIEAAFDALAASAKN